MPREREHRPKKIPARKITPDGLDERSENIGDTCREDFNLRTERRDIALGRSPRDAPASVHNKITRHKQQARKFTEHAARPAEAQIQDANTAAASGINHLSEAIKPEALPLSPRTGYLLDEKIYRVTEIAPTALRIFYIMTYAPLEAMA